MSKLLLKTDIKREEGFLYFCRGDPLEVCSTAMVRGRKKKKSKKK